MRISSIFFNKMTIICYASKSNFLFMTNSNHVNSTRTYPLLKATGCGEQSSKQLIGYSFGGFDNLVMKKKKHCNAKLIVIILLFQFGGG